MLDLLNLGRGYKSVCYIISLSFYLKYFVVKTFVIKIDMSSAYKSSLSCCLIILYCLAPSCWPKLQGTLAMIFFAPFILRSGLSQKPNLDKELVVCEHCVYWTVSAASSGSAAVSQPELRRQSSCMRPFVFSCGGSFFFLY